MSETERQIRAGLRAKYVDSHAILEEVPDATGQENGRADAIGVSLWRSKAFELTGFEIKVSRADWHRERCNPEKALRFSRYCAFWYLVTVPGVAERAELPPGWGLMVQGHDPREAVPTILRPAKRNKAVEPVPVTLWVSMLRAALKSSPAGEEFKRGMAEGGRRWRQDEGQRLNTKLNEALTREYKANDRVRLLEAEVALMRCMRGAAG